MCWHVQVLRRLKWSSRWEPSNCHVTVTYNNTARWTASLSIVIVSVACYIHIILSICRRQSMNTIITRTSYGSLVYELIELRLHTSNMTSKSASMWIVLSSTVHILSRISVQWFSTNVFAFGGPGDIVWRQEHRRAGRGLYCPVYRNR